MANEFGQLKVLALDDDQNFLQALRKLLEERGCAVEIASDLRKAAAMAMCRQFHVAFVDCVLRAGQGGDFVARLRSSVGSSVDVVLMSGVVSKRSISGIFAAEQTSEFLPKPISPLDLDRILAKAKEKYIYSDGGSSLLLKLFGAGGSLSLHNLKFFISLKKAKDVEIFLIIAGLLAAKENVYIKFSSDGKNLHTIFLRKGRIINYAEGGAGKLLSILTSRNVISLDEAKLFKGKNSDQIIEDLSKACCISSWQANEIKRELFLDGLKSAGPGAEISLEIKLFSRSEEEGFQINQSEFADMVFPILKQGFHKSFAALFSEDIMEKTLKFDSSSDRLLPEAAPLAACLREGMKLKGACADFKSDSDFYPCLLYILFKGNVFFDEAGGSSRFFHIAERYGQLSRFMETENPETVFTALSGLFDKKIDLKDLEFVRKIYNLFLKGNHADSFSSDLPDELKSAINKVSFQIRRHYDDIVSAVKEGGYSKKKEGNIKKEMETEKLRRACKFFLEQEEYDKAASCFKSLPEKIMEEDVKFQMLYLWLSFAKPQICDQQKKKSFLKKVNEQNIKLKRNYLYIYILGLYYREKGMDLQAQNSFRYSEKLEPSFRPAYAANKEYRLKRARKTKGGRFFNMLLSEVKKKIS